MKRVLCIAIFLCTFLFVDSESCSQSLPMQFVQSCVAEATPNHFMGVLFCATLLAKGATLIGSRISDETGLLYISTRVQSELLGEKVNIALGLEALLILVKAGYNVIGD